VLNSRSTLEFAGVDDGVSAGDLLDLEVAVTRHPSLLQAVDVSNKVARSVSAVKVERHQGFPVT